ncbi:tetratricopeptide (TPR) repeat protein [Rhodoblastus acidophilus]|uniref:tetratricopeptide repeat-containing glycosyltransferase family protein n=1 Tax=Rhodoblastus acidophilus TaxID=1074 RepID=UPI002224DBF3|nr:tetratricopeptide repeat-containing glycosyltransferase family protein [Rhodoblastus acidophilus]MCW2284611.1 tetratricopeptide (TPR) repeat protein [Rhodoblastus acidophilus]MCW2333564.1 tetratricopeptide (TPR) repeat protein [Rhodoblastus acidophilus]
MRSKIQSRRATSPSSPRGAAIGAPDHLYRLGMAEQAAGRLDAAIDLLDQALRLRPDFPEALFAGGCILQRKGRAAGALAFYNRALELKPDDALGWFNSGVLLLEHEHVEEALARLERACALRPTHAGAHCNRGAAYFALGRLEEAIEAYGRAIALDGAMANAHLNLGNALMRLGRYREARQAYLRAVALRSDYVLAYCGLGIVNKELGLFDEAMRAFDRALALEPESAEGQSNRGCLQLLLGDFAEGWEGYEYRWDRGRRPVASSPAHFDLADPGSLAGRKILVVNDHGLGDTIQFFRYIVLLARAGAAVTFAGPAKMRRLLASSGVEIAWRDEHDLAGDFDATLAISSLPRACATRRDSIPAPIPYLQAEPERVAFWRERMAGAGPKIGLCWRGNVDFRVDPRRSIPAGRLSPLATAPAQFFCLQKDPGQEELPQALATRVQLFGDAFDAGADAFIDTAAVMANLDLVITCDTSIAHLAGALGRPVWVALRHISEWRWMNARSDSPWYPTMRLFRCPDGDDWTALFATISAEIGRGFGR